MRFLKKNKLLLSLGLVAVLLSVFVLNVVASPDPIEPIETGHDTSLTIQYTYGIEPMPGTTFHLYRVGDVTQGAEFRINEPFLSVYDPADAWDVAASKMAGVARPADGDPVTPKRTGETDENGVIEFRSKSGEKMTTGLYLVVGEDLETDDGKKYTTVPFVVSLPTFVGENHDGVQSVWNYNVIVAPKSTLEGETQYELHYIENYPKINDADVSDMPDPKDETFPITSSKLIITENPLSPYGQTPVNTGSGSNHDKNTLVLSTAEPKANGYSFLGWNTDPDATVGYSSIAFDPATKIYNVYAIWEEIPVSSEEPPVSSEEPVSSDEPVSSEKPPVSSDEPVSSEKPPVSSDEPVSSEKPPVSSDEPTSSDEPAGTQYEIYYYENYPKINNQQVRYMPQHETFPITSSRLKYMSNPYTPYTKKASGANTDKNTLVLAVAEPQTNGYTFIGWHTNPDATVGYSTIPFDPAQRVYNVYAIWEADPEASITSEEPVSSDPVSSNTPGGNDKKKDPILPQTGVLWWPVPVLALLGLAVFGFGYFYGKKNTSDAARSRSGMMFIAGIVLVSSAVCLVLYNTWDNFRAGSDASKEQSMVVQYIAKPDGKFDRYAETHGSLVERVTEMSVKKVQGTAFSAVLSIPSLELELPIRDEWSYPGLRRSPCRFSGSSYTDNLVICGHNYNAHFGRLKKLSQNDEIILTAMNGDVFRYRVAEVTELSPSAYEEMTDSGYNLTLFTCTVGGAKRVTVRCKQVGFKQHSPNFICSEYILY